MSEDRGRPEMRQQGTGGVKCGEQQFTEKKPSCVGHQDPRIASLLWPNAIKYFNQTIKPLPACIP